MRKNEHMLPTTKPRDTGELKNLRKIGCQEYDSYLVGIV